PIGACHLPRPDAATSAHLTSTLTLGEGVGPPAVRQASTAGRRSSPYRLTIHRTNKHPGTPRGFNHFYERYERAQSEPDWAVFQFTTEQGGTVSAEELASAARELDVRCYRQEV